MSVSIPASNATEGSVTSGNTITVALNPSPIAVGDLMVVVLAAGSAWAAGNAPAGWTYLDRARQTNNTVATYYRIRQAGDPTSQLFTGPAGSGIIIYAMFGFRSTVGFDVNSMYQPLNVTNTGSATIQPPAYTANLTGEACLAAAGSNNSDGSGIAMSGTGWTNVMARLEAPVTLQCGYKTTVSTVRPTFTTTGTASGQASGAVFMCVRDGVVVPKPGFFFGTNH